MTADMLAALGKERSGDANASAAGWPDEDASSPILAAATLIEARLLPIGTALDQACGMLDRQAGIFTVLADELSGPAAQAASAALAGAVAELGREGLALSGNSAALQTTAELLARLRGHVQRMSRHASEAAQLAVWARLEASRPELGMGGFTEFGASLRAFTESLQANLAAFDAEIRTACGRVEQARSEQHAFSTANAATLATVCAGLEQVLADMGAQRQNVAACSAEVAIKSRAIQDRMTAALLTLQVGDSTRQRLEHVCAALAIMAAHAEIETSCNAQIVRDLRSRLARALLTATSADFSQQVATIPGCLLAMANEAREILQLGARALGGAYLARLQADMHGVAARRVAIKGAQVAAHAALHGTSQATNSLMARVGQMHRLVADMHVIGLNSTFKSRQLGRAGASMAVISQELRGCGRSLTEEALACSRELAALAAVNRQLDGGPAAHQDMPAAPAPAGADAMISQALGVLSAMQDQAGRALASLAQEGEPLVRLLEDGAKTIRVDAEVTALAQTAIAALPPPAASLPVWGEPIAAMLARVSSLYTMAAERGIHSAALGLSTLEPPEAGTDDDWLF